MSQSTLAASPDRIASSDTAAQQTLHYATFNTAFDAGDLQQAEAAGVLLRGGPPGRVVDVWMRLGLLRRRARLTGVAIEAFLEARHVAAGSGRALPDWFHSELSGAYLDQRAWALALEIAEAGLAIKPMLGLTAAAALVQLGRIPSARMRLEQAVRALRHEPSRATAVAATCTALLAADLGAETRDVVAEAAAAFSDAPAFAELGATLAFLRQDWPEAARRFAALFEARTSSPAAALQRLNGVLRHAPGQGEAYAALFEGAVLADPDNEAVVFQWRDMLAATLTDAEITARYAALQARAPTVLPALLLQLARRMPHRELLDRFAAPIASWQRSDAAQACQAYLDALCRFADPGADVVARASAVSAPRMRLFFLLRQPRLRAIRVRQPTPEDAAVLHDAGVDVPAMQAFLGAMVGPLAPEWSAALDRAAFASPAAERIVRLDEGFTAFQDRIVRDREFAMVDPLGGGPADLFDSVKIHDRQVFSFRGQELLTVQTGGNMNFVLFVHLVGRNIVLLVDTADAPSKLGFYASDAYVSEVQALWLRRAARNHAALLRSAAGARAARGTTRRVVAIHGRAENPAHHIWNYLPAFERLVLAGTVGNLGAVVAPPTPYFGPVADLFPELAGAEFIELPEAASIDPCPFSPHDIALQLGSSFIPRSLMGRVRQWARRQVPAEWQDEMTRLAHRRPIIWVGLRAGDKAWVNQAAGLARMIDLIVPLYPDALFVLDGFSLPDHMRTVPDKWHDIVFAIQAVATDIRGRTAFPDAVHSMVGNLLSESVLWAEATDAYFTPLGSSQHKIGWYGSAPGLVYTSPVLAKTPPEARQGAWEAEGSRVPQFLIGTIADPGQRRGNYDFRNNLENIDFEPHVAARRLLTILGSVADPS